MKPDAPLLNKQVGDALAKVIKEHRLDRSALARAFGVSVRHFSYWLSADRLMPLYILPQLCKRIEEEVCRLEEIEYCHNAYGALDILERSVGRHAFSLFPMNEHVPVDDLRAIQGLVREVGVALDHLSDSLADGIITDEERDRTIPRLDSVIRECGRLKKWLQVRSDADREKAREKARKMPKLTTIAGKR